MVPCHEATVVKYLDWMTELPWANKSKINSDLNNAQNLDEDHYGLEKLKRIIEFLAVQKNTKNERTYSMFSWPSRIWKNIFR